MDNITGAAYTTFVVMIIFSILAVLATIGRFATRKWRASPLGIDDWLLLPGVAGMLVYVGLNIWGLLENGSIEPTDPRFNPFTFRTFLKSQYLSVPMYSFSISFLKFSLLCLYRRIFTIPGFQKVSLWVLGVCFLWMVANVIATYLYCIPMNSFWDQTVPGRCFNFNTYFLGSEIAEVILDIVILVLPLKPIAGLHLPFRRKAMLAGVFTLGGFVAITGIIRIIVLYQPGSVYVSFMQGALWTAIQLGVAVICAALPTYRPLVQKLSLFPSQVKSAFEYLFSTRDSRTRGSSMKTDNDPSVQSVYRRMENPHSDYEHLTAAATGGKSSTSLGKDGRHIPMHAIEVRREVEVV